jgi:hypothetical protein
MARAIFVKSARKDIYNHGKVVDAFDSKTGQKLPHGKLDRSIPEDENDILLVKKGESYYWWKFNFQRTVHISKTAPRRSQLTNSGFLSTYYDLVDNVRNYFTDRDDVQGDLDSYISEIESLRDEQQSSLENMPEHLQENSASGETLRERIDSLENWINELQGVDTDIDEELSEEEKEERYNEILEEIESLVCEL